MVVHVLGSQALSALLGCGKGPLSCHMHTMKVTHDGIEASIQHILLRIQKQGAIPAMVANRDEHWWRARLYVLCKVLSDVIFHRVSFSSNRFFLHQFVPHLLAPGDAFCVCQESSEAQQLVPQLLCLTNTDAGVDAREHTAIHDVFSCDAGWLPRYEWVPRNTEAYGLHCTSDASQMARMLVNAAAAHITRQGGCNMGLYLLGNHLGATKGVVKLLDQVSDAIFT